MIRLHHVPQSRSMRTLWLLYELGLEFEVVEWPLDKSLRSDEFLNLNPAGRVPALEIDGQTLWETGAITEILCERFSPDELGRSAGHSDRADWLIWLHFSETITQHCAALTQQHIALRDDSMRSPIVMKLEAARIKKCYAALDARLNDHNMLLSSGFSAADVSVGQAVYMAGHFAKMDEFAHVSRWFHAISGRPAFKKSLPRRNNMYAKPFYPAWE